MADHEVLMSVTIDARRRHFEVTTLQRGKGRHTHYASIKQVPPELRGEALGLVRDGVLAAGYSTLAELETALTAELVVPEKEPAEPAAKPAPARPARGRDAAATRAAKRAAAPTKKAESAATPTRPAKKSPAS